MNLRHQFVIRGLSDAGVRVYLYPAEDSEPVGSMMDGSVIYYKGE